MQPDKTSLHNFNVTTLTDGVPLAPANCVYVITVGNGSRGSCWCKDNPSYVTREYRIVLSRARDARPGRQRIVNKSLTPLDSPDFWRTANDDDGVPGSSTTMHGVDRSWDATRSDELHDRGRDHDHGVRVVGRCSVIVDDSACTVAPDSFRGRVDATSARVLRWNSKNDSSLNFTTKSSDSSPCRSVARQPGRRVRNQQVPM